MKIGIVGQAIPEDSLFWQNHTSIYKNEMTHINDIKGALESLGYKVSVWTGFKAVYNLILNKKLDVDFLINIVENCFGRNSNGLISGFLEINGIPYMGNDLYVKTITSDKRLTKDICSYLQIPTPEYILINRKTYLKLSEMLKNKLIKFPVVVKYNLGTMSYNTIKADNLNSLKNAIDLLLEKNDIDILCEEYIAGKEITVPIIRTGENARVISVIEYTDQNYNPISLYDERWKIEDDQYIRLNAVKSTNIYIKNIIHYSLKLYKYLGFNDLGRFDYRLSDKNEPYFLEANSIPTLAKESAFDPISYGEKESFEDILGEIIGSMLERYEAH